MDPRGRPLRDWLTNSQVEGVDLHCGACGGVETIPIQAMIDGLKAKGLGDENTGIADVASFMTKPHRCGKVAWSSRPVWKARRSSHVAG
jgi:hypothetical protein